MKVLYKYSDLPLTFKKGETSTLPNDISSYILSQWNLLETNSNIWRYKLKVGSNIFRYVTGMFPFLLLLNPERRTKRRAPMPFDNVKQSFNKSNFNFTKVSIEEIVGSIVYDDGVDKTSCDILVNVSPIIRYHYLLVPELQKCLPQQITLDSLKLVVALMFVWPENNIRIAFNSLCALASVNHLHYHLMLINEVLPIENLKCDRITRNIFRTPKTYPSQGFCFQIAHKLEIETICADVFKVVEWLCERNVAHNVMMTRGASLYEDGAEVIRIFIWPRINTEGAKDLDSPNASAMNVAVLEMSGFIPVFREETFDTLTSDKIEEELKKYSPSNFEMLAEAIKIIFP